MSNVSSMLLGSKILKSIQTFRREKEELKRNWPRSYSVLKKKNLYDVSYIIYPQSPYKIAWDFFVGALIMESVIIVPLRLGFDLEPHGFSFGFDVFVDLCFGIDMVLTFLTAYEHESVIIADHKKIFKHYIKTWFAIDFLSTFPFDLIIPLLLGGISPGTLRSIKLVRALRLFRLLKLFRVARLKRKIKDAKIDEIFHPVVYDLGGVFFWIFILSHIICCGFYYFSECGQEHTDWQSCGKEDLTSKYILSMYWTVATVLSVGYGDITLASNKGRFFSIFVIFLGSIIFGILVSTVQSSARNWDRQETERINKLNQVREYIYAMKVTGSLRRQMTQHFEYFYKHEANGSEEVALLEMPIILRQYALSHTKQHLMALHFFKLTSCDVIMEIVPHLNPFLTKTGDYIYREGEFCVDMFFLLSGCVEAYKKCHDCGSQGNYLVGIYQPGSEFGLHRAMSCTSVTWASFRSCDKCELMWLSNDSIRQLMESNEAIKVMFVDESRREIELNKCVAESISWTKTSESRNSDGDQSVVRGSFRIPNCVIHNNLRIIDIATTNKLLQNMELIDDETDIVTTYKTVQVVGKQSNDKDFFFFTQETTEQMWKRWIINPHSDDKLYFDLVIVVMVMASSLTVPYRLGLGLPSNIAWSVFDGFTEVFFCFDLIASFMTAYEYKDGTLDTRRSKIAIRYLRSWFLVDFLSAVPLYRVTTGGSSSLGVLVRLLKTLKLGRLLRLFKVFKFARVMKLLEISNHDFVPNELIAIQNSFGLLFKMMALLGFTTHIIACVFSWISIDSKGQTWASEADDIDSTFDRYVAALYWTYATMATVGYGDIHSRNDSERLFSIVVMVLGSTGLAYIISEMADHVFNKGSDKGQQDHQLSISRIYFLENASPQSWRDAMIQHFSFLMEKQTAFDHRLIWAQLPHSLRNDLIHHVSHDDFSKIALFKSVKTSVLCTLYKYTEYSMVPKDSYMYTFETGSGGLYFVTEGYAEVVDERDASKMTESSNPLVVIAAVQEGMFFGHENLLNTSFDFLGIRAKSELTTLFIPNEKMARMKVEVPLIYDTLVYLIGQAVSMSVGTYDVDKDIGVLKRNLSRIMRMRNFWSKKTESFMDISTRVSRQIVTYSSTLWTRFMLYVNSDIDEAKGLYQVFNKKSEISEIKENKKKIDEKTNAIMSECSFDKFHAMKAKKRMLEVLGSPKKIRRSVSRSYTPLQRVSEDIEDDEQLLSLPSGHSNNVIEIDEVNEEKEYEESEDESVEDEGGVKRPLRRQGTSEKYEVQPDVGCDEEKNGNDKDSRDPRENMVSNFSSF